MIFQLFLLIVRYFYFDRRTDLKIDLLRRIESISLKSVPLI